MSFFTPKTEAALNKAQAAFARADQAALEAFDVAEAETAALDKQLDALYERAEELGTRRRAVVGLKGRIQLLMDRGA